MHPFIIHFLTFGPLILALIALVYKVLFNFRNNSVDKKDIYLELTIIAMSLVLIGNQEKSTSIAEDIASVKNSLEESNGFKIYDNFTESNTTRIISNQLNKNVKIDNSNKILSRTIFNIPQNPIGKNNNDWEEIITLNSFKSGSFRIKYFFGFEDVTQSGLSETDNSKRKKMQLITFKILTNPNLIKDDIRYTIYENAAFYYLPITKAYNSWSIQSSTEYYAGFVHNDQHWFGDGVYPTITSVIQIEDLETAKSLNFDHIGFEKWSKRKINQEMSKEGYNREPIMAFISSDKSTLIPKTLKEVENIYQTWLNTYYNSFGSNVQLTPQLSEFNELINLLKNESYY